MSAQSRPFPQVTLSDDHIRLRALDQRDAPAFAALCRDPLVLQWTQVPAGYTAMDALDRVRRNDTERRAGTALRLAIADTHTDELLGAIDLRTAASTPGVGEFAYMLGPQGRGRGVMTRAVHLLSAWAFHQHGLRRVWLTAHPDNLASQRVAERAGFRREELIVLRSPSGDRRERVLFALGAAS